MAKLALKGGSKTRESSFPKHPMIGEEEKNQILEVLNSGNISTFIASLGEHFLGGKKIREFEEKFVTKIGTKYANAFNSASSTLHAAVVSVSGTTALEAAFYKKPSIVFVDTDFSILPSVYKLNSIELTNAIHSSLKKNVDIVPLQKYVNFIENNSFPLDDFKLLQEADKRFYYGDFLQDVYLKDDDVMSFLEDYNQIFDC